MDPKQLAAEKAVEHIKDGMIVGLGTGSTAFWAIQKIAERVKQGLKIKAVGSSIHTETVAKESGIPLLSLNEIDHIDITIDGADEVDKHHNLIKGGGGALLREKVLAYNSNKFIVIVDESKLVEQLGRFPLPLEVIPIAVSLVIKQLEKFHLKPVIRRKEEQNFITDNGNLIIDCTFSPISEPSALDKKLRSIPGILETGLFMSNMVSSVIVGYKNGRVEELSN